MNALDLYNNTQSPKSSLGLAKKARSQAQDKDAVDNVSQIPFKDPEARDLCHSIGVYTFQDAAELVELPDECFSENDDLMWFPELQYFRGLTKIPNECFNGDRFVGDIILPSAGNLRALGEFAFCNCFELTKIEIPEGVIEIGRFCFKGCTELKTVKLPSTIKHIAGNSFDQCKKLEEFIVPASAKDDLSDTIEFIVNFIKKYTCNDNDIKVTWVDNVSESLNLGLAKKTREQSQDKDAIGNVSVIHFIEDEVRELCNEIDVYTYEDAAKTKSLEYAGAIFSDKGFEQFPEFQYFTGIEEIPAEFFEDNVLMRTIKLPSSGKLETIRARAFKNCQCLEEIVIPEGVKTIHADCFWGCGSLKKITLPSSLRMIAKNALSGCTSLKTIRLPKEIFSMPWTFNDLSFAINNIGHEVQGDFKFEVVDENGNAITESALGLAKKAKAQAEDKDPVDNLYDSWVLLDAPAWTNYDYENNAQFREKFPDRELYVYSSGFGMHRQMILAKLSEIKDMDSIYNWSRWVKTKKLFKIPKEFNIDTPIEEIKKYVSDNYELSDLERIDFSLRESNLGLAKKVSKDKDKSVGDSIENLITISEDDITELYNKWGHVPIEYQDNYNGSIGTPRVGNGKQKMKSVENLIRESYSKFITDMSDGELFFNHHLSWGQEGLIVVEFYDYRTHKNRRSLRNLVHIDYFNEGWWNDNKRRNYYKDFYMTPHHYNLIRDWYIPETVKCLKKHPEFIHSFLAKMPK